MVDPSTIPPIHFAPARGARLAYQVWGEGVPMVAIPPLAQNIEVASEQPLIRAMLERFGAFSRYLHFDKRGTGSSDRRSRVPGIDERVDDLRAVMDHAGIGSAHLYAQSDGGPMAVLFAVTYPHRVESLTLMGTAPCLAPPIPADQWEVAREAFVSAWGTEFSPIVDGWAPSLAADQEFRTWHQRYERHSATQDSLRDLLELFTEMDVTEVLGEVTVPTLVIHSTGDQVVPVEHGRTLAEAIPGATLLEVETSDHFAYAIDLDSWMPQIEQFVTGQVEPRRSEPPTATTVRVTTLGRFAVEVSGEEVPVSSWGSRRARQLCKRLVAARGWPVTRDELIDLLWPDAEDLARLGARLSVQLSAVKKVLDGGVIADRETVRLDLDAVSTDLDEFHAATDDGAIVAAYPGEFLPEDAYEDWTRGPRDEARARFVAAARRLGRQQLELKSFERAADLGRRILRADRYDEDAHQLLIDALVGAGEMGEAERAHADYREAMAELGIEVRPFDRKVF